MLSSNFWSLNYLLRRFGKEPKVGGKMLDGNLKGKRK